jgi:hypothetical protein
VGIPSIPSFRWGKSPKPVFQPWQSRRSAVARPTGLLRSAILAESKRRRFGNRRRHPRTYPTSSAPLTAWKLQAARISWDRSTPRWAYPCSIVADEAGDVHLGPRRALPHPGRVRGLERLSRKRRSSGSPGPSRGVAMPRTRSSVGHAAKSGRSPSRRPRSLPTRPAG